MSRGVLFMVWNGGMETPSKLDRAIASVEETNPGLAIRVETMPDGSDLLCKSRMYDLSPFDETLFLDADTVVLGDLSFGFEQAKKHRLACCICECPWARRFLGLQHRGDIVEYNTGVLFFTKRAEPVFHLWKENCETLNSAHYFDSSRGRECMVVNDQAGFAAAVADLDFNPFVLPMNWNFRKYWHRTVFGPIRVWHDMGAVTPQVKEWNARHAKASDVISFGMVSV